MTTTTSYTTACPHCFSTFVVVLPDDYRRCGDCQHRDHVSAFERAGAKVEPEPLCYEDRTGFTIADLEAQASAWLTGESEGGAG